MFYLWASSEKIISVPKRHWKFYYDSSFFLTQHNNFKLIEVVITMQAAITISFTGIYIDNYGPWDVNATFDQYFEYYCVIWEMKYEAWLNKDHKIVYESPHGVQKRHEK